jgi:AcrR family transcriptional regulator
MVSTERRRRRRLSVGDRRDELLAACLHLIGTRPWVEVSMAEVAAAAGVSKPLLYHYFATKADLYLAAVRSAADDLSQATRTDPTLPPDRRLLQALTAHLDWIDAHSLAYRAVLQGGISSDLRVQAIVEASRAETIRRLADGCEFDVLSPARRIALRGWVGFTEAACLDWLAAKDMSKSQLALLLAASLGGALAAANVDAAAVDA